MALTVTVSSPCPGQQYLNKTDDHLYQGSNGTFTFAVIASNPTYGWTLIVYDYSDPSGPCYPNEHFAQANPTPGDPIGLYGKIVDGKPDTGAGSATVV